MPPSNSSPLPPAPLPVPPPVLPHEGPTDRELQFFSALPRNVRVALHSFQPSSSSGRTPLLLSQIRTLRLFKDSVALKTADVECFVSILGKALPPADYRRVVDPLRHQAHRLPLLPRADGVFVRYGPPAGYSSRTAFPPTPPELNLGQVNTVKRLLHAHFPRFDLVALAYGHYLDPEESLVANPYFNMGCPEEASMARLVDYIRHRAFLFRNANRPPDSAFYVDPLWLPYEGVPALGRKRGKGAQCALSALCSQAPLSIDAPVLPCWPPDSEQKNDDHQYANSTLHYHCSICRRYIHRRNNLNAKDTSLVPMPPGCPPFCSVRLDEHVRVCLECFSFVPFRATSDGRSFAVEGFHLNHFDLRCKQMIPRMGPVFPDPPPPSPDHFFDVMRDVAWGPPTADPATDRNVALPFRQRFSPSPVPRDAIWYENDNEAGARAFPSRYSRPAHPRPGRGDGAVSVDVVNATAMHSLVDNNLLIAVMLGQGFGDCTSGLRRHMLHHGVNHFLPAYNWCVTRCSYTDPSPHLDGLPPVQPTGRRSVLYEREDDLRPSLGDLPPLFPLYQFLQCFTSALVTRYWIAAGTLMRCFARRNSSFGWAFIKIFCDKTFEFLTGFRKVGEFVDNPRNSNVLQDLERKVVTHGMRKTRSTLPGSSGIQQSSSLKRGRSNTLDDSHSDRSEKKQTSSGDPSTPPSGSTGSTRTALSSAPSGFSQGQPLSFLHIPDVPWDGTYLPDSELEPLRLPENKGELYGPHGLFLQRLRVILALSQDSWMLRLSMYPAVPQIEILQELVLWQQCLSYFPHASNRKYLVPATADPRDSGRMGTLAGFFSSLPALYDDGYQHRDMCFTWSHFFNAMPRETCLLYVLWCCMETPLNPLSRCEFGLFYAHTDSIDLRLPGKGRECRTSNLGLAVHYFRLERLFFGPTRPVPFVNPLPEFFTEPPFVAPLIRNHVPHHATLRLRSRHFFRRISGNYTEADACGQGHVCHGVNCGETFTCGFPRLMCPFLLGSRMLSLPNSKGLSSDPWHSFRTDPGAWAHGACPRCNGIYSRLHRKDIHLKARYDFEYAENAELPPHQWFFPPEETHPLWADFDLSDSDDETLVDFAALGLPLENELEDEDIAMLDTVPSADADMMTTAAPSDTTSGLMRHLQSIIPPAIASSPDVLTPYLTQLQALCDIGMQSTQLRCLPMWDTFNFVLRPCTPTDVWICSVKFEKWVDMIFTPGGTGKIVKYVRQLLEASGPRVVVVITQQSCVATLHGVFVPGAVFPAWDPSQGDTPVYRTEWGWDGALRSKNVWAYPILFPQRFTAPVELILPATIQGGCVRMEKFRSWTDTMKITVCGAVDRAYSEFATASTTRPPTHVLPTPNSTPAPNSTPTPPSQRVLRQRPAQRALAGCRSCSLPCPAGVVCMSCHWPIHAPPSSPEGERSSTTPCSRLLRGSPQCFYCAGLRFQPLAAAAVVAGERTERFCDADHCDRGIHTLCEDCNRHWCVEHWENCCDRPTRTDLPSGIPRP